MECCTAADVSWLEALHTNTPPHLRSIFTNLTTFPLCSHDRDGVDDDAEEEEEKKEEDEDEEEKKGSGCWLKRRDVRFSVKRKKQ